MKVKIRIINRIISINCLHDNKKKSNEIMKISLIHPSIYPRHFLSCQRGMLQQELRDNNFNKILIYTQRKQFESYRDDKLHVTTTPKCKTFAWKTPRHMINTSSQTILICVKWLLKQRIDFAWYNVIDQNPLRERLINSNSFIFGADFMFFRKGKMNSDLNMRLLLFTKRTVNQ